MADTVFVLGAGRMGSAAVRDLIESDVVEHIVVGDLETTKAEKLAAEFGSKKNIEARRVDLTNHQDLTRAIQGSKVLINAAWYEYNVDVMKATIEAGVHYLDMGGLFHVTRKQMELNDSAKKADVTAVLGAGESPGITNVMCACSADELNPIEAIRVRVGAREILNPLQDKLAFPFAVSTVFDEYSKPPIMYLNGQFQPVEPLSGEEEVIFAKPVGKQACHYSIHSEIATLPLNFRGVRHVDFKLGISEAIYRAVKPLVDAGMATPNPIDVKGHRVSPRDFAIALLSARAADAEPSRYVALRTEVTGSKNGKRVCHVREIVGEPSESVGIRNATALLTGIGASITAQLILKRQIDRKGVLAPETCIPTSVFMNELDKRKIRSTKFEREL